jgi:hypothetical protein
MILVLLALSACHDDPRYLGSFDVPSAVAVVQPETGGPFTEPVGYVGNADGGQIVGLALKEGRFVTASPIGSFVPTRALPTGAMRRIVSLATWAPDTEHVDVFAGDLAFGELLRVPHVVGVDDQGFPVQPEVTASEARFLHSGGDAADTATLADIVLEPGWTTTETWTIAFDADGLWRVEGSRSGRQERTAIAELPYTSDDRRVAFTIHDGGAVPGDRFELDTSSGLEAIDVGGAPLALAMSPDQSRLAMAVQPPDRDAPLMAWLDPVDGVTVAGPAGSEAITPTRMEWATDGSLFVADGVVASDGLGRVWEFPADGGAAVPYVLPWPVADVAALIDDTHRWLYVVPVDTHELWLYDLDTGELVDGNDWLEGTQPLDLHVPVQGITAMPLAFRHPGIDDGGVHAYGRGIAVATGQSRLVFVDEGTLCFVPDELGPRSDTIQGSSFGDYDADFNGAESVGPTLAANASDGRHVQVNPCSGVARPQSWQLHFDATRQGWEVEGTVSGVQKELAYEDQRYVSDGGEFSLLIRSGTVPTEDGWRFNFRVVDGALAANGDNNHNGAFDEGDVTFDVPTDPVYFHYRVGPSATGWLTVDDRPFVLDAAQGSDLVGRVEPSTGDIEVDWK